MGEDKLTLHFLAQEDSLKVRLRNGEKEDGEVWQKGAPLLLTCASPQSPTVPGVWGAGGSILPGKVVQHISATPLPSTCIGLIALERMEPSEAEWPRKGSLQEPLPSIMEFGLLT